MALYGYEMKLKKILRIMVEKLSSLEIFHDDKILSLQ